MKKDFWLNCLLYLPIRAITLIVRVMPRKLVLKSGIFFGRIVYVFLIKRKRIARANLKAAFGKNLEIKRREKIVKAIFKNFGFNVMELFFIPRMNNNYFKNYTKIKNFNYLKNSVKQNKGTIFLSAHYGNWEFAASITAFNGYPMYALAREQKPLFLNDLLNYYRQMRGTIIIQKGMQLRSIVKHLKQNGIIGMIGDQSGKQGKIRDFFGRPVFIADGAFRIAANTGAVILPAFNTRHRFSHELVYEKPIVIDKGEDTEAFIDRAVTEYRDCLEKYITKHPHLWLWGNRRWKHTSARSVLILNDGKTGHLHQAKAVADSIKQQCQPFTEEIIDIKFKNGFWEKFLLIVVFLLGKFIPNPMFFLKRALKKDCYKKLDKVYFDIVLCSGALTRAAALLLAKENMAKTISIMQPTPFSVKNFDLCIIPKHDNPKLRNNILITKGALNIITPESLRKSADLLKASLALKKELRIGLLIGGDSREYTLKKESVQLVMEQVKNFSLKYNAQILISTSRRTPKEVDRYLEEVLADYPQCIFKVFPQQENVTDAVEGILGVSNVMIVTGESISMVSEAATSGVYTIVFPLEKNAAKKAVKHERFLENLVKEKMIVICPVDQIFRELENYKNQTKILTKLNDREKLDKIIKDKILAGMLLK
ncbi:MAG: ELM1/GtrOC1 family putative glycosyltransferase [Candidatus Omnitrophota bacterium]